MGFINNANKIIGDNMRYLQQLQSNPQMMTGSQGAAPSPASDPMQMMMPMLMMMLFQLLSQNGSLGGQMGQNPYQPNPDPFGGLPPTMPMPPFQIPPNVPGAPDQGQDPWIQLNPAYQFLTGQLGNIPATTAIPTTTGTTGNNAVIPPSFDDNSSIAASMNSLFANNPDQGLRTLGTQLLSGVANGIDPDTVKARVENELIQQGASGHDIDAFGVLYDAMQSNNALAEVQVVNATNPTTGNANRIAQLTQNQQDSQQQWESLYPNVTASIPSPTNNNTTTPPTTPTTGSQSTTPNAQALTTSVQNALASGQFTPTELGQSLKYLLDHAPSSDVSALTGLISNLTKSGQLNILPFLHSKYLDKLTPDRQEALLGAVENSGLTLSNGQPNSRLAGYLLENLSRPGTSSTQNFLQQFLQHEWLTHGNDSTSPEGKALANVMSLAGLHGTVGQPLTLVQ